jgi:hypothetical protein
MVRDDLFDVVFRRERGLGGGREREGGREIEVKKACDRNQGPNQGLSPYFAIPFVAQRFDRQRRGAISVKRRAPLPGHIGLQILGKLARQDCTPYAAGRVATRLRGTVCEKQSINFALACWRLRAHRQWTPPQACRTYLVGSGRGGHHRRKQQEDAQGPRHGRGRGACRETKGWRAVKLKNQGVCEMVDVLYIGCINK